MQSFCRAKAAAPFAPRPCRDFGFGAADATRGEAANATPWTASTNSKVRLVAGRAGEEAGASAFPAFNFAWTRAGRPIGGTRATRACRRVRLDGIEKSEERGSALSGAAPFRRCRWGRGRLRRGCVVSGQAERESEPIELKVAFSYGLCKDLCIPNEVNLSLNLPADGEKGEALLLETALRKCRSLQRLASCRKWRALKPSSTAMRRSCGRCRLSRRDRDRSLHRWW